MSNMSIGDLAQSFLFQRRGVGLRTELNRLTDELSSGQVSDVRDVLAGNYSYLADLERDLKSNEAYGLSTAEASQHATGVQLALERIQTASTDLSDALLAISQSPLYATMSQGAETAKGQLNSIFAALNTDLAGRNLFAGQATDTEPLADVEILLADLETAVSGAATAQDIRDAAQNWFDDPAGFDTVIYNGGEELPPFFLSRDEEISIEVRANDQPFKTVLMNASLAALADSQTLAWDNSVISSIFAEAGLALNTNTEQIVNVRARVGVAQERIDTVDARLAAEATSLEFARNALLSVDTFETATELENVRFQLESLYTVTARLSGLSLVNFLR